LINKKKRNILCVHVSHGFPSFWSYCTMANADARLSGKQRIDHTRLHAMPQESTSWTSQVSVAKKRSKLFKGIFVLQQLPTKIEFLINGLLNNGWWTKSSKSRRCRVERIINQSKPRKFSIPSMQSISSWWRSSLQKIVLCKDFRQQLTNYKWFFPRKSTAGWRWCLYIKR